MLWSCASSETQTPMTSTAATGGTLTQQESIATNEEAGEPAAQAPMDRDTDMSAEEPTNSNISANNQVGRNMNIAAMIQQNPNLSTMFELIRAADMLAVLESPAPYTVFAPTNDAFAALPAGTLQVLKQPGNKMELTRILQSHVLPNRITSNEMTDNLALQTAQGEEVVVNVQGQNLKVGNAMVLISDVEASNGVIHVIDKVLLPPKK
ncbi:hypothetical protein GCM10028895_23050 [Pontibacter rugosus]